MDSGVLEKRITTRGRHAYFPDPPEYREPNSIPCHPRDKTLFCFITMVIFTMPSNKTKTGKRLL